MRVTGKLENAPNGSRVVLNGDTTNERSVGPDGTFDFDGVSTIEFRELGIADNPALARSGGQGEPGGTSEAGGGSAAE